MKMNYKKLTAIIGFLLALPLVSAQSGIGSRAMAMVYEFLQNAYQVYLLTFVLFFVMFYAIYASAAQRVTIFKENNRLSKSGKIFAVAVSGITCMGIFYYTKDVGIKQALENLLSPFGVFGGLGLAGIMFMMVWMGFKDDIGNSKAAKVGLFMAGLMMVGVGTWLSRPNIMSWGWFIVFIALLFVLFGGLLGMLADTVTGKKKSGDGDSDGGGDRDTSAPPGQVGPVPTNVRNFKAEHQGDKVELTWTPNEDSEKVTRYVIERSVHGNNQWGSYPGRIFRGWKKVTEVSGSPFTDDREFRTVLNQINNVIADNVTFEYRIRAVNDSGNKGGWAYGIARYATPIGPPAIGGPTVILPNIIQITLNPVPGSRINNANPGKIKLKYRGITGGGIIEHDDEINIEPFTAGTYTLWTAPNGPVIVQAPTPAPWIYLLGTPLVDVSEINYERVP